MINLGKLRRRLDQALRKEGRPAVTDQEWQYVQSERWIEGDGDDDVSTIVLNVLEARRVFGTDTTVDTVKLERGVPGSRRYALSLLLVQHARARSDLKEFRKEHLGGEPLPLREVKEWVLQKGAGDGIPTTWANDVLLPPASKPQFDQGMITIPIDGAVQCMGLATKYLRYPMPDHSVSCVPVRAGGTLHILHQLATTLSQTFHWTEAEAVMLVLTDEVPPVEPAKWQVHWSTIPCLSRITLTIDPALSPRQVESLYRRVRGQVLDGRYRNLTRKHALLAAFKTTFSELKLSDLMRKWNAEYPRWRYKLVTNFGRDTKTACDRLLTPSNLNVRASFGRAPTKANRE
jgi:hypothetical protein